MFDRVKCIGKVHDGDWDINGSPIKNSRVYKGLQQHFVDGLDWEDTIYFRLAKEKIEKKGRFRGYSNFDDFKLKRLRYLDNLYKDIKRNGYKTQ